MILYDEVDNIERAIIKRCSIVALIPLSGALFAGEFTAVKGLLMGVLLSFLLFRLRKINITKALEMEAHRARRFIFSRYIITYLIHIAVLYNAYNNPNLSFVATIIGLLLIKFTIIGTALYEDLKDRWQKKILNSNKQEGGV